MSEVQRAIRGEVQSPADLAKETAVDRSPEDLVVDPPLAEVRQAEDGAPAGQDEKAFEEGGSSGSSVRKRRHIKHR